MGQTSPLGITLSFRMNILNEAFFTNHQTAVDDHQDKLAVPLHAFAWEWRYLFFKHFGMR